MNEPGLTSEERALLSGIKKKLQQTLGDRLRHYILFGSRASGAVHERSDIDLAIVVDGLDGALKRTILDIIAEAELDHLKVVSALVLSTEDFEHLLNRERRIALDILQEGVPL